MATYYEGKLIFSANTDMSNTVRTGRIQLLDGLKLCTQINVDLYVYAQILTKWITRGNKRGEHVVIKMIKPDYKVIAVSTQSYDLNIAVQHHLAYRRLLAAYDMSNTHRMVLHMHLQAVEQFRTNYERWQPL